MSYSELVTLIKKKKSILIIGALFITFAIVLPLLLKRSNRLGVAGNNNDNNTIISNKGGNVHVHKPKPLPKFDTNRVADDFANEVILDDQHSETEEMQALWANAVLTNYEFQKQVKILQQTKKHVILQVHILSPQKQKIADQQSYIKRLALQYLAKYIRKMFPAKEDTAKEAFINGKILALLYINEAKGIKLNFKFKY
ncbi:hypothetical protein BKI52_19365 [marine bacterium AO1-C]|nr:hypothetical protein BKI52_19365 [marine bacterium AO1-C]